MPYLDKWKKALTNINGAVPKIEIPKIDTGRIIQEISLISIPKPIPEYIEKIKPISENIIKYPRISFPKITQYNIIQIVQNLQNDVETLKEWRKQKIDPDITNIFNNINDTILPGIANSVTLAKNAANDALYSSDIAKKIADTINNDIIPGINNTLDLANKAKQAAQQAVDYVTAMLLKIQLAGEVLYYGAQDIYAASTSLFNTLIEEGSDLSDEYISYAITFYEKAKAVATEAYQLGSELVEAKNQIGEPLGRLEDEYNDLKNHISDWDVVKAMNDVKGALQAARDLGEEVIEAFQEIGTEAVDLSVAMGNFGIAMKDSTVSLATQLKNSYSAIRRETGVLANTLIRVFDELKNALSEEYTPERLAEERARYRASLNKYLGFKDSLLEYDKSVSICEKGNQQLRTLKAEMDIAYKKWINDNTYWKQQYAYYETIVDTNEYKALIAENARYKTLSINKGILNYGDLKFGLMNTYNDSHYYMDKIGDIETFVNKDCIAYPWICGSHIITTPMYDIQKGWIEYKITVDIYERNKDLFYYRQNYEKPYEAMLKKRGEIKTSWDNANAVNQTDYNTKKQKYNITLKETQYNCSFKDSFASEFKVKYNLTPEEADLLTYEQIINL